MILEGLVITKEEKNNSFVIWQDWSAKNPSEQAESWGGLSLHPLLAGADGKAEGLTLTVATDR